MSHLPEAFFEKTGDAKTATPRTNPLHDQYMDSMLKSRVNADAAVPLAPPIQVVEQCGNKQVEGPITCGDGQSGIVVGFVDTRTGKPLPLSPPIDPPAAPRDSSKHASGPGDQQAQPPTPKRPHAS